MGSIHIIGVNTMQTISDGVQTLLQDIQAKSANVGVSGGYTVDEFQAYMLDMETRLDMLKKLMDSVEQAVRSFHKE
ncbi:MAG: hypothetical protein KGR26_07910 [Cyanobacteria bacterium REEB65]|nr:hypothetical protein [Cyanobacteria bacterium REEB65]